MIESMNNVQPAKEETRLVRCRIRLILYVVSALLHSSSSSWASGTTVSAPNMVEGSMEVKLLAAAPSHRTKISNSATLGPSSI